MVLCGLSMGLGTEALHLARRTEENGGALMIVELRQGPLDGLLYGPVPDDCLLIDVKLTVRKYLDVLTYWDVAKKKEPIMNLARYSYQADGVFVWENGVGRSRNTFDKQDLNLPRAMVPLTSAAQRVGG